MAIIEHLTVREQVRDALIERIISGVYPPGYRLVELRIAEEFGTSQGPVREALRELESQRLVESERNRGTRVRTFKPRELVEIYHVRSAVERLACDILTREKSAPLGELRSYGEMTVEAAKRNDLASFVQADYQLHLAIVTAADNSVLSQTWRQLITQAQVRVLASIAPVVLQLGGDLHVYARQHMAVIEALERGEDAGLAMKAHLDHGANDIARAVESMDQARSA